MKKKSFLTSCAAVFLLAGVICCAACIWTPYQPDDAGPEKTGGGTGNIAEGPSAERPGGGAETPDPSERKEETDAPGIDVPGVDAQGAGVQETDAQEDDAQGAGVLGVDAPGADVPGTGGYVSVNPEGGNIRTRINPPEGFARIEAEGFADFLREYPLLEDGAPILLHDGRDKWTQGLHVAVFDMPLVSGDLQQCADSCMRLYAEYFYGKGCYDKIAFHLVNGFLVDFDTWRKGGRVSVDGNRTEWVMSAEPSDSQETFEKYLRFVFTYASTLSMELESEAADLEQVQAGDLFIKGGSPGHVVMVLDVCENEAGDRAFLLGQGYMPAQQFHVLKNPAHDEDPWYYVSEVAYPFETPEYIFAEGAFKRPVYDLYYPEIKG